MKTFKSKNMIEKSQVKYTDNQKFCCQCNRPINKNSYEANQMCNRCFVFTYKDYERRKMSKSKTRNRQKDRDTKFFY